MQFKAVIHHKNNSYSIAHFDTEDKAKDYVKLVKRKDDTATITQVESHFQVTP